MNWFYCFVFIQSSIVLLHGRPEHSNPITFDRKLTLEVGNASGEAIPRKHLVANVYVEAPSSSGQSHKRLLKSSPHSSNSKKIDLDNASAAQNLGSTEAAEKQQTLVASSSTTTAAAAAAAATGTAASLSTSPKPPTTKAIVTSTDIPKTRYNSKILSAESTGSKLTKRIRIGIGSRNSSCSDNYLSNRNNSSVAGKRVKENAIRKLENRQILYPTTFILSPPGASNPSLDLNHRYVYNMNSLISTTTVLPPNWPAQSSPSAATFVTASRPPSHTQPMQTAYVLPQQEYYAVQPHQPGVLNVETTFNSLPGGGAAYQPTAQPIQNPLQFPAAGAAYATNVTRLHSVVSVASTTPDPYRNFQKMQTRPIMNRRKVLKIHLSTPRPHTSTASPDFTISIPNNDKPIVVNANNKKKQNNWSGGNGNNNNRRKNNNNNNKNRYGNQNNNNNNNSNRNKNNGNNKNNNKNNNNNNNRRPNNNNNNNNNNQNNKNNQNHNQNHGNQMDSTTQASTSPNVANNTSLNRLCSVSTNQSNSSNDNVCDGGNNLKIIIKFDADSLNSTREALKPKPSETVDSVSEEDDDSDEWEYFYDAPFGLGSVKRPAARRRHRGGQKQKPGGHGNKDQETINKFQTIILQTPRPPTPPVLHKENDHRKHSLFHKFISILPFLTLLKPMSFGFWTIVLSPILVIAVSGMALAVVLYPWVSISKEHAAHTAIKRPPTVVIHKHERPNHRNNRKYPQTIRYAKPTYSRRQTSSETINRTRRPAYNSYDERRPRRHISRFLRRNKRRADMITGKYTFKDINFQHWLLIKNNFEIRHLTWNDDDDDTDYAR